MKKQYVILYFEEVELEARNIIICLFALLSVSGRCMYFGTKGYPARS